MAFVGRALKDSDRVCSQSCFIQVGAWTMMFSLAIGLENISLEYRVSRVGLPLVNAKGNLLASIKASLGATLRNLSRWRGDGSVRGWVDGACLQRGEIRVSFVDSVSNEDEEVGSSLFLVKEMTYCLSPNLGVGLGCPRFDTSWNSRGDDRCSWFKDWLDFLSPFFGQEQPEQLFSAFEGLLVLDLHQSHLGLSTFMGLWLWLVDTQEWM